MAMAIAMVTTIQVSEETRQLLGIVKENESYGSYEAVIRFLLEQHTKTPKSMFGKLPKHLTRTKKDKREIFHEL